MSTPSSAETAVQGYAHRLHRLSRARWKRVLNVQAPYGANTRRICSGAVLDIGCGIGRNLGHLRGRGMGVDHNAEAVRLARSQGFQAATVAQFLEDANRDDLKWDTLLLSHILEHLTDAEVNDLLETYLPFLAPNGRLVMICPQEWAYARDETHKNFLDLDDLREIAERHDFVVSRAYSFPWPRWMGRWMPYGEFVLAADRRSDSGSDTESGNASRPR